MKKNRLWFLSINKGRLWKILLLMKIFIFLSVFCLQLNASVLSQTLISLKLENTSLKECIREIEASSGLGFLYNGTELSEVKGISIDVNNKSVEEILSSILSENGFEFIIKKDVILITKTVPKTVESILQEEIEIIGKITDSEGTPLPGATILEEGTLNGVISDADGNFKLTVKDANSKIKINFIGFASQTITVGNKTVINVILKESAESLDEVIITGYQKVSVERSTGSAVTVKAEDVEKKGQSNLMNTLEGMVAGLGVIANPDSEGSKTINIRGVATIRGNSNPLLVIDGFPVETTIDQINPYDVESVTVLKDAGSASIYGARAANGVIVITTKRGKKGKTKINYTNSFTFNQRPDVKYRLNRLSSSDLVDVQMLAAESSSNLHTLQWYLDNFPQSANYRKYARTIVYETMAQLSEGSITQTEADAIINPLRSIDNISQIQDIFTQNPYEEQHNLSMSGGGDRSVYRATLNYTKNKTSFVGDKSERFIFDIQNSTEIGKRFKIDLSGNFTVNDQKTFPYNRDIVLYQINSYELFRDANGNPLPTRVGIVGSGSTNHAGLYGGKDPLEIQRLIDMGLYDETYYPLKELYNYNQTNKGFNARLQALLYADIVKGLKGTFGFKYETSSYKNRRIAKAESFEMMSLVNNMSPNDYSGDDATLHVPRGARLTETRGDAHSYTLRAQLDYEKEIQKHNFRALAGSEVRHVFTSSITTDQFGYDESSLLFKPVDKNFLTTADFVEDINHPFGYLAGGLPFEDNISEKTDRFFSLYGNFSYDFDQKYVVSGSMRIDQSNLFGTDPEYRYKPFWSLGAKWNINEEEFFKSKLINKLAFRFSYGINGNIANDFGPFNIAGASTVYRAGSVYGLHIISPAIEDLRWERTATTNFGADISMLDRRIKLSMDYYIKNTNDILAFGKNDPTTGFRSIMKNDANIKNTGFEVSLNTTNIKTDHFRWTSTLAVRHNKNRVKKVLNEETYVPFIVSRLQNVEGHPANSYYLYNWAGLDDQGNVRIYTQDEEMVTVAGSFSSFDIVKEDLVYAGTSNPKFTGAFSNNLSYKNFDLSFMFVFSYGHVLLKDTYNGDYIGPRPDNIHADAALAWKEPGDEEKTDVPILSHPKYQTENVSKYSTKNIIDGGYIRLRELILTYTLPQNALKFFSIQNATLNFRANNLFLIAKNKEGIDPEAHGIGRRYFPIKPSYSFGINIGF